MTVELVLATHNRAKLAELQRILQRQAVDIRLLSLDDVDYPEPDETGDTFAENALIKARAAVAATGKLAVADDSGLVVDALGGEPGVRSARFAGRHGDDRANLELVLERMAGVSDRRARFVCVAALVTVDGVEHTAEGVLEGELVHEPRGTGGFGYDPIFQPLGAAVTTAEMTPEQKDAVSHRGQAFREIAVAVAQYA
ncbi:MAG TPA: RdgB/HAM1 family non-canonical purine NTP pyrophosphatase [Egibacteraceae bacterium]|nr:RdgB/HAM1 family non-canonical purine NTP pyrophosphatase [Egibacteraceae bacterium]